MAKRYTLWDPNIGNVDLGLAVNAALAAGTGITIAYDPATGLTTVTAQDQVDDFASPPPLGSTVPNTVDATSFTAITATVGGLTVTGMSTLSTAQIAGLTVLQTSQLAGVTATGLAVSGNTALHTTQIAGLASAQTLAVTGLSTLSSTQVAGLTVANAATYTANGATPTSVTIGGLTANSTFTFGIKTPGGTVGAVPTPILVNLTTGQVTIKATALDTSVYNVNVVS